MDFDAELFRQIEVVRRYLVLGVVAAADLAVAARVASDGCCDSVDPPNFPQALIEPPVPARSLGRIEGVTDEIDAGLAMTGPIKLPTEEKSRKRSNATLRGLMIAGAQGALKTIH
jgi:hypothetical protein